MAADTRPYKSKEQDGQGNEVIIRDQQLVEQSTVTTMPSDACFETLDIDGRPVKIPRDNMMSIVLECIGIVLNDSSKNLGTNVNKALGLQGNTIGNVTVNDFASVLGVWVNYKITDNVNDFSLKPGLYYASGGTGIPDGSHPYIFHLGYCQFGFPAFDVTTLMVRMRNSNNTWQDWKTISLT